MIELDETSFQIEKDELHKKLEDERRKRVDLENHLEEVLREHNIELQGVIANKEKSLSDIQSKLAVVEKEKETISLSEIKLKQEVSRLSELLKKRDSLVEGLRDQLKQMERELSLSREDNQKSLNKIGILTERVSELEDSVRTHERSSKADNSLELSKAIEEINNLKQEIKLKDDNQNLKETNLQQTLNQSETLLEVKEQEIAELHQNCKDLTIKLHTMEQDLNDTRQKNLIMNQTITSNSTLIEKLTIERDSLLKTTTINDVGVEPCCESVKELETLQVECDKYKKDLKRLREHLVLIEEERTQEALQYNQLEIDLNYKIKTMEEEHARLNAELTLKRQASQSSLVKIQEKLDVAISEREASMVEVSRAREESAQHQLALQNLQNVLEHFQSGYDQSDEIKSSLLKKQRELNDLQLEYTKLCEKLRNIEATSNSDVQSSAFVESLQAELHSKTDTINKLTSELDKYKMTLNKCKEKIEKMSSEEESKIDKSLVKNLFVMYTSTQDKQKKDEMLALIGKILEISPKELFNQDKGWFPQLWQPARLNSTSVVATPTSEKKSFSRIFVSFLESESAAATPQAPPIHVPSSSHPRPPSHIFVNQTPPNTSKDTMKESINNQKPPAIDLQTLLENASNNV
jgi:chromosome segregation ATPase